MKQSLSINFHLEISISQISQLKVTRDVLKRGDRARESEFSPTLGGSSSLARVYPDVGRL